MNDASVAAERRKAIENIYPLSPMQEGLLFHTVTAPKAGLYVPQMVLRLDGEIDVDRLKTAWQDALQRHAVLRSGFHWEEREHPFQVVHRQADLPWFTSDWRLFGKDEQHERLHALLAENRTSPFDLRRPALMRLHWIDTGRSQGMLVFAYHHLILDGWSASQLVRETFQLYLQSTGTAPPPPRPYADYIAWLKRQDHDAARAFWAEYLVGLSGPTRLFPAAAEPQSFERKEWVCPQALSQSLKDFCKARGLTMNTVLQGALALFIAEATGKTDVIFGATVAGRPATLANAAAMIGLFINTLPVRANIDPALRLDDWLAILQRRQAETVEHEYLPLRQIQGDRGALFDCLFILESYPVSKDLGAQTQFQLTGVDFDEWTHYPLTVFATLNNDGLTLTARYSTSTTAGTTVADCLDELENILERIVSAPSSRVADFPTPSALKLRIEAVAETSSSKRNSIGATPTPTEKVLAAAWMEVLKGSEPQPHDHFFELGGHSLLAAKVINRVRRDFGMELPVKSLFDRPVLGDLAAYIDALRATRTPSAGDREIEI